MTEIIKLVIAGAFPEAILNSVISSLSRNPVIPEISPRRFALVEMTELCPKQSLVKKLSFFSAFELRDL
jgi:hypothetical protein